MRAETAALKEVSGGDALGQSHAYDCHFVFKCVYSNSHCFKHFHNGGGAVRFLVPEPFHTFEMAFSGAEGRQHGDNGEKVRAVVEVCVERAEGRALNMQGSVLEFTHGGAGFHEDIHYGDVGLEGMGVKACNLNFAENCARNKEWSGAGPVSFNGKRCRLICLRALYPEI